MKYFRETEIKSMSDSGKSWKDTTHPADQAPGKPQQSAAKRSELGVKIAKHSFELERQEREAQIAARRAAKRANVRKEEKFTPGVKSPESIQNTAAIAAKRANAVKEEKFTPGVKSS